jgi:hypothetical protein
MSDPETLQNLKSQTLEFTKKYNLEDGKKLMHNILSKKLQTASIDSKSSCSSASCSFDNISDQGFGSNPNMVGSFPPPVKQSSVGQNHGQNSVGQNLLPNPSTIRLRRMSSTSLSINEGHTSPLAMDSGMITLKRQNSSHSNNTSLSEKLSLRENLSTQSGLAGHNLGLSGSLGIECEAFSHSTEHIQISLHSPHSPAALSNRARSPLCLSSSHDPGQLHFSFSESGKTERIHSSNSNSIELNC